MLSNSQKMTSAEVDTLFSKKQKIYIKNNLNTIKSNAVIFFKTNDKKLYYSANSWVAKWYGYNSVELSNVTTVDANAVIGIETLHRSGVDLDSNYKVIKTSKLYEENGNVNTQPFNNSNILDTLASLVVSDLAKGDAQIIDVKLGEGEVVETLIPLMVSNVSPKGVVSASRYRNTCEPYKAFDNNTDSKWQIDYTQNANYNDYLMYTFAELVNITKWACKVNKQVAGETDVSIKAILKNDSEIEIGTFTEADGAVQEFAGTCNVENVKAIKLQPTRFTNYNQININEFQVFCERGGKQIQSVMLGTKEIWSNWKTPYFRRMDFSSTNHYSLNCEFDTRELANIKVTKFVVCSTTRSMQGDSYVDASCMTANGAKWGKNAWFNNGTRTETGTLDGVAYTLIGEARSGLGRYTMEFAKPIKIKEIKGSCGSGVGQWVDTDRMYIEVTGLTK